MPALTTELLKRALGDRPSEAQRRILFEAADYAPYAGQDEFHFAQDAQGHPVRFKLAIGGEQAGKSKSSAMELFSWLPWGELYWIVGPDYEQTRNEFRYIMEALYRLGAVDGRASTPDKGPWKLKTIWGTELETKSADDPATIAGKPPDGILLVEAAQTNLETFLRCMGRVGPKRGWVCINGTFEREKDEGRWFRQYWKSWQGENLEGGRSFSLPSWDNHHLYPGGREDPEMLRLERLHGPDWFNERFAGIPVPPKGLVFREFEYTKHVKLVERVDGEIADMFPDRQRLLLPVDTEDEVWIDPGYAGGYAVLFVTVHQDIAVVYDEIYKTGWTGDEMAVAAIKHPRWKYVKKLVMDIAGRQHQAAKSQEETWYQHSGLRARANTVSILDGIERTRISLRPHPETGIPGLILGTTCPMTAYEFSEGYKYVDSKDGVITNEKPRDANNHSAKAIAYGLTDRFGPVSRRARGKYVRPPRRVAGWEAWA